LKGWEIIANILRHSVIQIDYYSGARFPNSLVTLCIRNLRMVEIRIRLSFNHRCVFFKIICEHSYLDSCRLCTNMIYGNSRLFIICIKNIECFSINSLFKSTFYAYFLFFCNICQWSHLNKKKNENGYKKTQCKCHERIKNIIITIYEKICVWCLVNFQLILYIKMQLFCGKR